MNTEKERNVEAARAALEAAKEIEVPDDRIVETQGVRIRIEPVPINLLDDVQSRIKDPKPPMFMNEQKGRKEPNPHDPDYLEALEEADRKRTRAAMDAMVLFGIELLDGLPEDDGWIEKLEYMEKLGTLDLSSFDLEDKMDREFLFKRYIVSNMEITRMISKVTGVTPQEVERIEGSFPGDEEGSADKGSVSQE